MRKRTVNGKVRYSFGPGENADPFRSAHRLGQAAPSSSSSSFEPRMEIRAANGRDKIQTPTGEWRSIIPNLVASPPADFRADRAAVEAARERGRIRDLSIRELRDRHSPQRQPRPVVRFVHDYRQGGYQRHALIEWDGRTYRRVA